VKKYVLLLLLSLIIAPVTVSAANYLLGDRRDNWQTADRRVLWLGLVCDITAHDSSYYRPLRPELGASGVWLDVRSPSNWGFSRGTGRRLDKDA
jgi:hypothetical protein